MMKAIIRTPRTGYGRLVFLDRLDNVLDLGFEGVDLRCVRIRNEVAHDGKALDQLGHALDEQQRERDHHQRLGRPLWQPAGISRLFVDLEGTEKEWNAGNDHDDSEGKEKKCMANRVNPIAY